MKSHILTPKFLSTTAALMLSAIGSPAATTLLSIDDLVRPASPGANTFITGVTNAVPSSATLGSDPATLNFISKTGTLVAYFDAYTLDGVGKSLTLDFTATFSDFNNASGGFRVGLFDSTTLMTADLNGAGAFTGATGYGVLSRAAASSNDGQIFRRDSSQANILSPAGGTILSSSILSLGAVNGTSQSGKLTLERTAANTVTVTWQFGAQSVQSVTDVGAGIATSFDTVAFYFNNSISPAVGSGMNFTTLSVTAVPEPSYALLLGGVVAGLVWKRRRHCQAR